MVRGLTVWSREDLAGLVDYPANQMPVIAPGTVEKLVPGIDLWDIWPFRLRDGSLAEVGGRQIWAALSAPAVGDPGGRHDVARIRMISTDGAAWSDHGNLFPDGASLGSREWAGSCVVRGDRVQAYYTAAGRRGESSPTFGQRIAGAAGRLVGEGETLGVADWEEHRQVLVSDGERYHRADEAEGEPGFIKAFRDPFPFTDPATGHDHLLFTASEADATTDFNGAIGIARRGQG